MPDPNNMAIHDRRLVLMFICKAANTSIKEKIVGLLGLPDMLNGKMLNVHKRAEYFADIVNKRQALELKERGYLVVSAIRHPMARVASCWREKLVETIHRPLIKRYKGRIAANMPFEAWIKAISKIPDSKANQHFRSMTWDLVVDGQVVPEVLFRIENAGWWDELRTLLLGRCGLDIGKQIIRNKSGVGDWRKLYNSSTWNLAAKRYADDLRIFGYDT